MGLWRQAASQVFVAIARLVLAVSGLCVSHENAAVTPALMAPEPTPDDLVALTQARQQQGTEAAAKIAAKQQTVERHQQELDKLIMQDFVAEQGFLANIALQAGTPRSHSWIPQSGLALASRRCSLAQSLLLSTFVRGATCMMRA